MIISNILNSSVPSLYTPYTKGKDYLFQFISKNLKNHSYSLNHRLVTIVLKGALFLCVAKLVVIATQRLLSSFFFLKNLSDWSDQELSSVSNEKKDQAREAIRFCYAQRTPHLCLKGLDLPSLPSCISSFTWVTDLDLSWNEFKEIPEEVQEMIQLRTLNVSSNPIRYIPGDLHSFFPKTLKNVSVLDNLLSIEDDLRLWQFLDSLNIVERYRGWAQERNEKAADAIKLCNQCNLTSLSLKDLNLTSLPSCIFRFTRVTNLDLSGNWLRKIPLEIQWMEKLKTLNLMDNPIQDLSLDLLNIESLQNIYVNPGPTLSEQSLLVELVSWRCSRDLEQFKQEETDKALQAIVGCFRERSTQLNLSNLNLRSVPDCVFKFNWVTDLDLSGNRLKDIPKEIQRMAQLEKLDVSRNQIAKQPWNLVEHASLLTIFISGNQIPQAGEKFFLECFEWTRSFLDKKENRQEALFMMRSCLKERSTQLNLANLNLRSLPDFIFKLNWLTDLDLSGNRLEEIPERIQEMTQLKRLNISRNHLKVIPELISKLTKLEELDASDNYVLSEVSTQAIKELFSGSLRVFKFKGSLSLSKERESEIFFNTGYRLAPPHLPRPKGTILLRLRGPKR